MRETEYMVPLWAPKYVANECFSLPQSGISVDSSPYTYPTRTIMYHIHNIYCIYIYIYIYITVIYVCVCAIFYLDITPIIYTSHMLFIYKYVSYTIYTYIITYFCVHFFGATISVASVAMAGMDSGRKLKSWIFPTSMRLPTCLVIAWETHEKSSRPGPPGIFCRSVF